MTRPGPIRRVLMTADTVGGVWTYAMELAAALGRERIEVILASMGRYPTEEQRHEAATLPLVRLQESSFKLEWMDEPWEDVAEAGRWLLGLERAFCPDAIHLNGYCHAALHWRAPAMIVAHSCVLSWWKAVKGEPAPQLWNRYREGVQAGLLAAKLVAAPTFSMASEIAAFYGVVPGVRVIPNGRTPAQFRPAAKKPFIFAAGRLWDSAKNVAAMGEVAPALSWPIYVAGEQHPTDAGALPLRNMYHLGKLTAARMADWLSCAAIFALPARYEPFGLTVLEAALSGCVLVLGDIPSLRENWEGAALFVRPDDRSGLQAALSRLIADASARDSLAACSRQRALEFSPDRMASAYLEAYSELCAPGGGTTEVVP